MPENQDKNNLKYWLAYSQIATIGPVNFKKLADYFVDAERAWRAGESELRVAGLDQRLTGIIQKQRALISPDEEWEKLTQAGVTATLLTDRAYPRLLKEIPNPPPILYWRGSLDSLNQPALAVVGTRKFSPYGRQAAEGLTLALARYGLTIISGLALGIDAIAHRACLAADRPTIAVLGSGVNRELVSPFSHQQLAEEILADGGALVSEYPVGTHPSKVTFPMRNRIISGLALGVLVIEAPASSGSLITARHALEQNREVFAVPGSIYHPSCQGTNWLIKQGAKPVTSPDDILEELNLPVIKPATVKPKKVATAAEQAVLEILSQEPVHIDKLRQLSKLNINALSSFLMMLELKGLVKDVGGKNYIKI